MPVIERYARHWSRRPRWVAASLIGTALLTLAIAQLAILSAAADAPATAAFQRTWARTDQPVTSGQANRTWMWGPSANTGPLQEPYADAPGGVRTVQYFDKSRMEDNSWRATAPWDVTDGLLVVEMVTGQMQVGDTQFQPLAPAVVNIAGDPGEHPTYADINTFNLQSQPATPVGTVLTTWMDATGILPSGPTPPSAVTAAERLTVTSIDHTVASVFWTFMNSSGTVFENGQYVQGPLFQNPYYATGYPITEAYWSTVKIGETPQTVLWQCFQRRCLTYNPANGPGWQVEAGNVGQHYYQWRTTSTPIEPTPTPTSTTTPPGVTPTVSPSPTSDTGYKTFTDGVWKVGKDIQAGTYRSSKGDSHCYWDRLSGFSGMLDDVIANDVVYGRAVVTIASSDAGFQSEDCGTWSSDLSPITTSQTASFGNGAWIVGVDIAPGTWSNNVAAAGCYWERVSDFSGDVVRIIDSGDTHATGVKTITIAPTDAGFKSWDCGTWTRVGG